VWAKADSVGAEKYIIFHPYKVDEVRGNSNFSSGDFLLK